MYLVFCDPFENLGKKRTRSVTKNENQVWLSVQNNVYFNMMFKK